MTVSVDIGEVAGMIAVPRVHRQDQQIALLDFERLGRHGCGAAHIDDPFREHSRPVCPTVLEPPGNAVAAYGMGVNHASRDTDAARQRTFPDGRHELRRRWMHGDLVRRHRAGNTFDRIRGVRDESRQIGALTPPAFDGGLVGRSSGFSHPTVQETRRERACPFSQDRPLPL